MFRHKGNRRTLAHNLRIASLLSFVAGVVNVTGFLAIQQLTTNVTGHFAFFVEEVYQQNFIQSIHYFLYILFFFLGAFFSSLSIETVEKINPKFIFRIPVIIESLILISVAVFGRELMALSPNIIAYALLFAMGLQNSLVTTISNATVRTTHLTGLFTDLGIETAQYLFHKAADERKKLWSSIKLRLTIINFFFVGGLVGGYLYSTIRLYGLILVAILLLIGLVYDYIKFSIKRHHI